jgi:hypothetical protein
MDAMHVRAENDLPPFSWYRLPAFECWRYSRPVSPSRMEGRPVSILIVLAISPTRLKQLGPTACQSEISSHSPQVFWLALRAGAAPDSCADPPSLESPCRYSHGKVEDGDPASHSANAPDATLPLLPQSLVVGPVNDFRYETRLGFMSSIGWTRISSYNTCYFLTLEPGL